MSDFGELTDYISGICVKRLSAVELAQQHELNGIKAMQSFLNGKAEYDATFLRLDDDDHKIQSSKAKVTWYDAREKDPTRSEFRLYYQENPATTYASEGDLLCLILKTDGSIIFTSAPANSQCELELIELVGKHDSTTFNVLDLHELKAEVSLSKRIVLEELGFEVRADFGNNYLDLINERFGFTFPTTREFSQLAREIAGNHDDFVSADAAILKWWDVEEAMFLQFEGEMINSKLGEGFSDAEDFLSFSQTIRQRRNSRAGYALENHIAHYFDESGVHYAWGAKTENNKKPDFLFPSIESYLDTDTRQSQLTMLGVKTTCKDRWRQVLTEADKIQTKHLFTLQPGISENQTHEMRRAKLQLVVPEPLHDSYRQEQRDWLWSFEEFVGHVISLQTSL